MFGPQAVLLTPKPAGLTVSWVQEKGLCKGPGMRERRGSWEAPCRVAGVQIMKGKPGEMVLERCAGLDCSAWALSQAHWGALGGL